MAKQRKTLEDAPLPRLVLPALRSWIVKWHDPTQKKLVEEIATGHQLAFPQPNMMVVQEFELEMVAGEDVARALIRKVIVSDTIWFEECSVPTMSGASEIM